jgi:hypothetical protein
MYRLAHAFTSAALPYPELTHSHRHGFLLLTARSGLALHDDDSLTALERGYADSVDGTPLVTARPAASDKLLVALPHHKAGGHTSGGVYFFRRGRAGDIRWRAAPHESFGVAAIESHPRLGFLACVTARGQVFLLQPELAPHFPGPMFPPGFVMMTSNREYGEAEDEFDRE